MATADQIRSLIDSHFKDDKERFHSVALQIAAHEARQGHRSLALSIQKIINSEKKTRSKFFPNSKELNGLIYAEEATTSFSSLVVSSSIKEKLKRILLEYRQRTKLKSHGLNHRRKILLVGPPGTGKTMTAKVLAHELALPLYTVQVDRLVTKFMGETSAKLRQIFDMIKSDHGVYLFDEFDAIGGDRGSDNDVGEMRRVLNSLLQFIEQDPSDSIIVAATNNPHLLDSALFRRFDDVLTYQLPSEVERKTIISNKLGNFITKRFGWKSVLTKSESLSQAEISHACDDAIKSAILQDKESIIAKELFITLSDRHTAIYPHK